MNREKQIWLIVFLTLLGMIGLYVGGFLAWRKYEDYQARLGKATGSVGGALGALLGG